MNFSAEERALLERLAAVLPKEPSSAWGPEKICATVGKDWPTVSNVILKSRRAVEEREPVLPLIRYGKGGYCLVGWTDKKGRWRLS
jgi:hypothetical protein